MAQAAANALRVKAHGDAVRTLQDQGLTWVTFNPIPDVVCDIDFGIRKLPELGLLSGTVRGVRHVHAHRDSGDGNNDFSFHLNVSGLSTVVSRRGETTLRDGDAMLLSYSAGRTINRPGLVDHRVIRLPRASLRPLVQPYMSLFRLDTSWNFFAPVGKQRPIADHPEAAGRVDATAAQLFRPRPRAVGLGGGEEAPADLVVAAIGVVPNTAFLAGSALTLSKGGAIEVDDALKTSAPDIWAAGDCANVTWADGSRRPEQLWYTARDQGRLAARSMLGDDVSYRRGTWYNSAKFFDLEWTTAGWVPVLLNWDNTPIDPGPDVRSWFQRVPGRFVSQRIVVKGDRVIGFNFLGSRWDHEPLMEWIHERRSLSWVLEHLHEAQFDEEFMPRFRVLPTARLG